jgi:hypothetical protein
MENGDGCYSKDFGRYRKCQNLWLQANVPLQRFLPLQNRRNLPLRLCTLERQRGALGPALLFVSSQLRELLQAMWTSLRPGKRVICGFSGGSKADLQLISGMVEAALLRPVIDRECDLAKIVAAHRFVETGRKRGCLIIRVAADRF